MLTLAESNEAAINASFILFSSYLVFFMQCGFAILEVGSTKHNNTKALLTKNLVDTAVAALCWLILGHGLAKGESLYGIIGTNEFGPSFINESNNAPLLLLEVAFAGAVTTIISEPLAERATVRFYIILCSVVSCLVYSVVSHWVWSVDGWLMKLGYIDFAGATVIHTVAGMSGFTAAWMMGARNGRFEHGNIKHMPGQNVPFQALGVFILFFCWFGFNSGALLRITGDSRQHNLAGISALNTLISGLSGGVSSFILQYTVYRKINISHVMNCVISGLVSISASPDSIVITYSALIGGMCAVMYPLATSIVERRLQIDDPLNAFVVHACSGYWGVIATGLFHSKRGLFITGSFRLLGVQLLGSSVITVWSATVSFVCCKICMILQFPMRVSPEIEKLGLDAEINGPQAYDFLRKDPFQLVKRVIENTQLFTHFENFLILRNAEKYLTFYLEVIQFREVVDDRVALRTLFQNIYKKYISIGSEFYVELPSWIREYIKLRKTSPSNDLFEDALVEVKLELVRLLNYALESSHPFATTLAAVESEVGPKPLLYEVSHFICCRRRKTLNIIDISIHRSNPINDQNFLLLMAQVQKALTFKIFLLGSSSAGKSTFAKQLDYYYNTKKTLIPQKDVIFNIRKATILSIQHLIHVAESKYKVIFRGVSEIKKFRVVEMSTNVRGFSYTKLEAFYIKSLWDSKEIRKIMSKRCKFWYYPSTEYLLSNCIRFADSGHNDKYVPDERDMLYFYTATVGYHEYNVRIPLSKLPEEVNSRYASIANSDKVRTNWMFLDVGGSKEEQKKWLSYRIHEAHSILYFVDTSSYQSVLKNNQYYQYQIEQSLAMLESFINTNQSILQDKTVFVIFNKINRFHDLFNLSNFIKCFPGYKLLAGQKTNFSAVSQSQSALSYLKQQFINLTTGLNKTHSTSINTLNKEDVINSFRRIQRNSFVDDFWAFDVALKHPEYLLEN